MMKKAMMMLALALVLAGCSNTKVRDEWKDPGYQGGAVRSVLVVVLPPDREGNRCADQFVEQLKRRGVKAEAGYRAMPDSPTGREEVLAKAKELGFDSLLASSFLNRKTELAVYPRQNPSVLIAPYYDFWPTHDYVENEYLVFATVLYDTASGKPVWSAVSDTFLKGSDRKASRSYAKAMVKKLERQRLLVRGEKERR